jgi:hypothetical protein
MFLIVRAVRTSRGQRKSRGKAKPTKPAMRAIASAGLLL